VPPGADGASAVAGRILVPVFLTVKGEGELVRRPALERAAVFLEPDGRLGVRVDVSNDGNVHVPLTGSIELSSQGTDARARLGIAVGRVLPGTVRTYAGDATVPLPLASTYDVIVTMGLPDEHEAMGDPAIREAFTVDAIPTLDLADVAVCENLDRGPTVSGTLVNDGALGVIPTITFAVVGDDGQAVDSAQAPDRPLVWPGDRVAVAADLSGRLSGGSYTLVANAAFGPDLRVETSLPFSIGGDPSTAAPLCAADDTASPEPQD
jgi:hypothetical protein